MLTQIKNTIIDAGELLLSFSTPQHLGTQTKDDLSPVTNADKQSNILLTTRLKEILDIPVLSEESLVEYDTRKHWKKFWLIDPLDGTKELINGDDDFSICIALIEDNRPVMGAIYAPKLEELYMGGKKYKFIYEGLYSSSKVQGDEMSFAISRYHNPPAMEAYAQYHNFTSPKTIGSALKFGRLALGDFSIYPRFQGSWEWDIAAGHAILDSTGGKITDLVTLQAPLYNKKNLKNNFFIAKTLC